MVDIETRYKRVSITKMKYGWSKHGGARHGLVKQGGNWYCQACGNEQPDDLPAFMMCVDNNEYRDFIRLCAVCESKVERMRIRSFQTLKKIVEKRSEWERFSKVFKEK